MPEENHEAKVSMSQRMPNITHIAPIVTSIGINIRRTAEKTISKIGRPRMKKGTATETTAYILKSPITETVARV